MYKKVSLNNGLRIITVPQKGIQAVTVLVLVGTGSKYEKKEVNGISHFLEHMFFKGTKKRPGKLEIAETLDKVGGIYNAFTGEEYTGYFAKVKATHLDLVLNWVSDIYLNSTLPAKEVERERKVIMEEINMHYDIPTSYVGILWNKLLYGDQPAGWDIAGTKQTIQRINRQDLVEYMENQYVAPNTIICVAGKIKNSTIFKKIKKYFSEIKITSPQKKPPVIEKQTQPQCLLHFRKTDQTHLCFGVRGYNLFHPQKYTQDVLSIILGGMMSSRLFMEVRERLGLAYYIKTSVEADPDTGYLVTQAGVDNSRVDRAISAILKEYKKVSNQKIPIQELKKAKQYIKGKMALTLESSDALASFYSLQEILKKEILTPEQIYAKIDRVTTNDVLKVAGEIFCAPKLNLTLIGPFKNKSKFQQLLKI